MTSSRKTKPAYGIALMKERESGKHPTKIFVIYGRDWKNKPAGAPCLCVDEQYAPDRIEWLVVAGVSVEILWRSGLRAHELVAEIAQLAAPVSITYVDAGVPIEESASAFLDHKLTDTNFPLWDDAAARDYMDRVWEYAEARFEDANSAGLNHGR